MDGVREISLGCRRRTAASARRTGKKSGRSPVGTKLSALEDLVVAIRQVISEKMLHEALQRQAGGATERPAEYRACPSCGGPTGERDPEPRYVQTRGGGAEWQEPHERCTGCRRDFFPSVEKSGH